MTYWLGVLTLVFLASTAYLASFATPSIFYMANVLFHIFGGALLFGGLLMVVLRKDGRRTAASPAFWLLAVSTAAGAWLAKYGATFDNRRILTGHIIAGLLGVAALFLLGDARWKRALTATAAAGVALFVGVHLYRLAVPDPHARIRNPRVVPASMEEEGAGPKSPFWPSSANTNLNTTIPSDFFMDSKLCGECHKDIYEQWNGSMHHFASFNNQFYRKSIEQMQELGAQRGSKWCAGCHDHAVFFNGRFEKPIKDQIDTPEAHTGLGCVSCHSIVHVEGSMGNGGFTIEYPPLHRLASSRNKYIRWLDRFLTYAEPEPHRRTFLKPFMRQDSAEFCSSCHKVHLDIPVNNYRWLRGFNDYDNWQASGVSGQGARSFYYPLKPSTCADCHMPLVASSDPGNRDGMVHSHRFPAANTAVAVANRDEAQLKATRDFLESGFITMDIFAAAPVEDNPKELQMRRRATEGPQLMSTFAVGEESEQGGEVFIREVGKVAAPLDRTPARFQPGSTLRLDVVVRTRKIGHFFPGGTVDAFDVWIELEAVDAKGRKIFHSGAVGDGGRGPVEKGAHFYRSYMLDGEGNQINKRNAWQARSVLYVRLIPPGAADVAHYRLRIPPDAEGPITIRAALNHRKFAHYYTQYVYAGKPASGKADKNHDSREYSFDPANIPANVSGAIKDRIPEVPVIALARAEAKLQLGDVRTTPEWRPVVTKADRERWNDWGIGLLLQGDLKGAEYAFLRTTEAEPDYADGWINVARALIQEGQTAEAKPFLEKARKLNANLGRLNFFQAMAERADGDYDAALASLRKVEAQYPRDRVVLNQIGRLLFLKRDFAGAVAALQRVLEVDPEDVQAHYNLMLSYRGLGQSTLAEREEKLFRRFKADESAQTITAKPRLLNQEDNNERQPIHDHESVSLPAHTSAAHRRKAQPVSLGGGR